MFSELRFRWTRSAYALVISVALHLLALMILVWRPHAIFVRPYLVAAGNHSASSIVYMAAVAGQEMVPPEQARLRLSKPMPRAPKPERKTRKVETQAPEAAENASQLTQAGSRYGSSLTGLSQGHDVRPALPLVFPDPVVARSEIPRGVEGNVVVEITIDVQGNVVETRLVQGLGYGIEEKVIATVQNWRFKPATQDGVAIASQQDVSFHFPS